MCRETVVTVAVILEKVKAFFWKNKNKKTDVFSQSYSFLPPRRHRAHTQRLTGKIICHY